MGLGVGPQQAETHLFRGKRSGWVLRICNTNALLAIIMPNLAQTWLYQKIRYTKSAEKPTNSMTLHIEIWYNGFCNKAGKSLPAKPAVNFLV